MIITTADGWRYQITPEDLVTLGISMEYEGGTKPAATLWTYAQRLAAFRGGSMRALVQGHSQPVNPRWRRDGVCCAPEGSFPGQRCNEHRVTYHNYTTSSGDTPCSAAKLRRRDEAGAIRTLDQLRPATRALLLRWANGQVPNPAPRAIDFAAAGLSSRYIANNPGAYAVLKAGNWYLVENRSKDWPAGYVSVAGQNATEGGSGGAAGVLLLALAAGAGYAYYKSRRRGGLGFTTRGGDEDEWGQRRCDREEVERVAKAYGFSPSGGSGGSEWLSKTKGGRMFAISDEGDAELPCRIDEPVDVGVYDGDGIDGDEYAEPDNYASFPSLYEALLAIDSGALKGIKR